MQARSFELVEYLVQELQPAQMTWKRSAGLYQLLNKLESASTTRVQTKAAYSLHRDVRMTAACVQLAATAVQTSRHSVHSAPSGQPVRQCGELRCVWAVKAREPVEHLQSSK